MRHQTGATGVSLYSYCFPGRRVSEGNALFASCQNEIPKMFHVNVSQKCHRTLIEYIAFAFALREMLTFTSGRLEFSAHFDIRLYLTWHFTMSRALPINTILIKLNCLMTVNKTADFHTLFISGLWYLLRCIAYCVPCISNSQLVFDTRE